jgi:hypothetical protein
LSVLAEVGREARAQGDELAAAVDLAAAGRPPRDGPAQRAAAGPRADGNRAEYELLVELIREGYLLHYEAGRVVVPDDPDLALLAGDQLYALGLVRLARLGDLEAVTELADAISLCAQAHAASDGELARAVWRAAGAAVGHGPSPELRAAKAAAAAADPGATEALSAAADAADPP